MVVTRFNWYVSEDHPATMLRWDSDAGLKSCSDLLDDFLNNINRMETEYLRAMADLYGSS
ncbi:hypothetical protein [Streptomyces sp. BK340]|uniref:hypothetical protein n=1 Tax=Streptomyces sp. BK340 TaxID=2572903 RepID=UPI0011A297A9|nr:hypothetical protein [Streptomyces sp. BK340]TVZ97646.1 hypothetical protein FB157_102101 [Streptomyces sp. BK340]